MFRNVPGCSMFLVLSTALPVYPNPKQKPNIVVVVVKQLQSIIFMLFFNNPGFLRKFPLIKLQRFWQTSEVKINNSSKYHSMAALFRTFYFKIFFWALPIPAVSQWSTLCARVLVKIPQPISSFWDLSGVCVLKLTADQVLVSYWIAGSCQVNLLKTGQDCSEAC